MELDSNYSYLEFNYFSSWYFFHIMVDMWNPIEQMISRDEKEPKIEGQNETSLLAWRATPGQHTYWWGGRDQRPPTLFSLQADQISPQHSLYFFSGIVVILIWPLQGHWAAASLQGIEGFRNPRNSIASLDGLASSENWLVPSNLPIM